MINTPAATIGTPVCPGSSGPFYIVTYYIKWVTTSWTHSSSTSIIGNNFMKVKKFGLKYSDSPSRGFVEWTHH